MTCHAARRIGELERRLCRERREAGRALVTTDAELASCERVGDSLDDSATEMAERRLSAGSFGVCETCARPIPFGRLRALPTARLCVVCEATAERMAHR
jgi:RNA polymerase-binding transcription factor DksA